MPSPYTINGPSAADDAGYAGDNQDLAPIHDALAAVERAWGIPHAYGKAPNAPPAAYPFSVGWLGDGGIDFANIALKEVGGRSGMLVEYKGLLQRFIGEGPISTDRAVLQYETDFRPRRMARAYGKNTQLGVNAEGWAVVHKCELKNAKWASTPYGKTKDGKDIRHLGWLLTVYVEGHFTVARG